jgi:hypothetical protein
MPNITDSPPAPIQVDLDRLRDHLNTTLPAKCAGENVLLATWNLRAFGGLTKKWVNDAGDSRQRNFHAIVCIAEIVSRIDVIAVQGVKGDLRALRYLLKVLGERWAFLMTDVVRGDPGNDERMAFLFDTKGSSPPAWPASWSCRKWPEPAFPTRPIPFSASSPAPRMPSAFFPPA